MIVLTRGGGSFEDLLPFSDERVVRAVAACRVPVVSAVGHEQDTPLCDLAADVRASTPTAAGKLVVPDLNQLSGNLDRARETIARERPPRARPRPRTAGAHRRPAARGAAPRSRARPPPPRAHTRAPAQRPGAHGRAEAGGARELGREARCVVTVANTSARIRDRSDGLPPRARRAPTSSPATTST